MIDRDGHVSRPAWMLAAVMLVALVGCSADDPSAASPDATLVTVPDDPEALDVECPIPENQLAQFGSAVIGTALDGEVIGSCMALADTTALRAQGLRAITDLGPYAGMVFAYAGTSDGGYTMRGTPMPLSIAWISSDGVVVHTTDMEPCLELNADCASYRPGAEYRWAIEVPQGGLAELGLVDGALLDVSGWPVGQD